MKHVPLSTIELRNHATLNEAWVHSVIAQSPTILGLGEVFVRDRERIQVGAGRLDLLLQDEDGTGRYEVEIQLGPTDPSHIIRTIEYWDIERKRYPQYKHTAVIVAEEITSRFLNVISLFNGTIPIMAFQMKAVQMNDGVGLLFTKVLDTVHLGLVDEDEEVNDPADRAYWESRASHGTVKLADKILDFCKTFASDVELSYNKHYIGLRLNGKACNFAVSRPRKSALNLSVKLPKTDETDRSLEVQGLDLLDYDRQWKNYRIRLTADDFKKHETFITELLKKAFDWRHAE